MKKIIDNSEGFGYVAAFCGVILDEQIAFVSAKHGSAQTHWEDRQPVTEISAEIIKSIGEYAKAISSTDHQASGIRGRILDKLEDVRYYSGDTELARVLSSFDAAKFHVEYSVKKVEGLSL